MSIAKVLQVINFKLTEHIKEGLGYLQLFVSNGTGFMSVKGRVQEIQSHKFTRVHQNHGKWFISWANSSVSDGDVTILLHTCIHFNLCYIQEFKSHVRR